jgi:adenylate cyclase
LENGSSADIRGDTVNIASQMESTGIPGEIQVSTDVRDRLIKNFEFEPRGAINIKGKGEMHTFLLRLGSSSPARSGTYGVADGYR